MRDNIESNMLFAHGCYARGAGLAAPGRSGAPGPGPGPLAPNRNEARNRRGTGTPLLRPAARARARNPIFHGP